MPRSQPPKGKVAPVADRIRGAITAFLALACLTAAANTHDAQWCVTFGIAGIIYFITTGAMMVGSVDGFDT
jgi:hypothetical protein